MRTNDVTAQHLKESACGLKFAYGKDWKAVHVGWSIEETHFAVQKAPEALKLFGGRKEKTMEQRRVATPAFCDLCVDGSLEQPSRGRVLSAQCLRLLSLSPLM